mmetsp:Transcript_119438/g.371221  ORF Transcript_119438/g.371221 Transcript_119438/m.371221 type:complete len:315 (-) Transcript_119438:25-969(-)
MHRCEALHCVLATATISGRCDISELHLGLRHRASRPKGQNSRLQNDLVVQVPRLIVHHVDRTRSRTCTLAKDHDILVVATEAMDVLMHPLHGETLVLQAIVPCGARWISASQGLRAREAQESHAVVDGDDNDVPSHFHEACAVVVQAVALRVSPSMDPKHHCTGSVWAGPLGRIHIQEETILALRPLVGVEMGLLQTHWPGLRRVPDALPALRLLRRCPPKVAHWRCGIRYAKVGASACETATTLDAAPGDLDFRTRLKCSFLSEDLAYPTASSQARLCGRDHEEEAGAQKRSDGFHRDCRGEGDARLGLSAPP